VKGLGKIVENVDTYASAGHSANLSVCSACAGDYEDPDWTAPLEGDEEAEEDRLPRLGGPEDFLNGQRMPQG
jgi:hypothetical protein